MSNVLSLVSYKIFPAKLGGQKGIALFNKYFSKHHNLICVTVQDNDPAYADYKVLNSISNSRFRYINIFYFFSFRRIIKKYKISHLIIEHPYFGWLGILLQKLCKVKLVVHSHNIEAIRFKTLGKWWWRILYRYEKLVLQHADLIFCITEDDSQYFIKHYSIEPLKCTVITYGIEWNLPPGGNERADAKKELSSMYGINEKVILYLFNGTLSYGPNLNAVKALLNYINPILLKTNIEYRIIICGKSLPGEMNELKEYTGKNIIYAGFVNDISIYFKGVDVFVNPVTDGGGIKTKLVEALAYNLNAVSTVNGAIGIQEQLCNGKLLLTAENDWQSFAAKMKEATMITNNIPKEYFENFYWENIAKKAAGLIEN